MFYVGILATFIFTLLIWICNIIWLEIANLVQVLWLNLFLFEVECDALVLLGQCGL